MYHFNSFVSQVCCYWCPPFSVGHVVFLFICLPGLSLLVSALFRWRCNISIYSRNSLLLGVFNSSRRAEFPCLPSLSLSLRSRLPPCLPSCGSLCPSCLPSFAFVSLLLPFDSLLVCVLVDHCVRLVSLLLSLSPFLSPFLLAMVSFLSPFVSGLVSLLVRHCVRLVSLLLPFVSLLVGHCVRLVSPLFLFVSGFVGHCVRLVSLPFRFVSLLVSLLVRPGWSLGPPCLLSVSLCLRSCLPSC